MISDKAKVTIDLVKRDGEGNYILRKGSIENEEIAVFNMYAPNGIASRLLKEKLLEFKEKRDSKTILVGELSLSLLDLNKSNQKINKKEVRDVNKILEKLELKYNEKSK